MKYKKFSPLVKEQERFKEILKLKLYANRPSLSELFQGKDKRGKEEQMHQACQEYGYTLKEISEYLGVHDTNSDELLLDTRLYMIVD